MKAWKRQHFEFRAASSTFLPKNEGLEEAIFLI
jgi:hypothetical protein